jgi:hypothetical protein
MPSGIFISRDEKASWGIPCNQKADGTLWVGKGFRKTLSGQFGATVASALLNALNKERGERYGRFWADLEECKVTMAVGESANNKYKTVKF